MKTTKATFSAPLWSSAFRPFYFLGALYAPLLVIAWLVLERPAAASLHLWHGHEIIFGFSAAIIVGIVLTALPSWAGTGEIQGRRLAWLVVLWSAGRVAFWAAPWLPAPLPALIDCLLFPTVTVMVAPQLLGAANRLYLLLLPVLLAMFSANLVFHVGMLSADAALASLGLRLAVHAIILLYVLKGGVLTPIFTGNALRETGRGQQAVFCLPLDVAAVASVVLLAVLDLCAAPAGWTGGAALACALLHGWRIARWQGWRVADVPLVLMMHLGYAWLVLAFLLKALAGLSGRVPEAAWLHAFTVGSLGLMMLGLMTRVSLRHTGRPLTMPRTLLAACLLMFAAAMLRLAASVHDMGNAAITLSATLWAAAFVLYFLTFCKNLVTPSAPRLP